MMTLIEFYKEIAALTRQDLKKQKMLLPPESLIELCAEHCHTHRGVAAALRSKSAENKPAYLSVLQKAYPEEGVLVADFKHLEAAQQLEDRVQVLAVNTEKRFFNGSASMLTSISHLVKNPVVRWDFIVDKYQIGQSRLWGADAIRLTVALLDQSELLEFTACAAQHELEVIIEINTPSDFERLHALSLQEQIVYINCDCTADAVGELLDKIPDTTPALLNAAYFEQNYHLTVDALVFDQARYATAAGMEKFRKSF